jgi:hypothetical protein
LSIIQEAVQQPVSFICGQSSLLATFLSRLGFLYLQRHISHPAPSHTVSKLKIESNLVRKEPDTERTCAHPCQSPSSFMGITYVALKP